MTELMVSMEDDVTSALGWLQAEILLAILSASRNAADLILQEKSARCVLSLIQLYPVGLMSCPRSCPPP